MFEIKAENRKVVGDCRLCRIAGEQVSVVVRGRSGSWVHEMNRLTTNGMNRVGGVSNVRRAGKKGGGMGR